MASSKYHEYVGVLHIHSRYSDGSGRIESIIRDAKKAHLDYIIITDHNNIKAMEDGAEGWHDDLLVLVGEEIGSRQSSHYMALGIREAIKPEAYRDDVGEYISAVKRQGGIGFIAHPCALYNPYFNLDLVPWSSWDNADYTGIEIWSYMYDWAEDVKLFNILYYYLFPERAIDGPPRDLLQKWDQLCETRRVVGIGGADAHARHIFPFGFIRFLSYKRTFRGIRTHLLTSSPLNHDVEESKRLVYSACASGHCFFALDKLVDSTGFTFTAVTGDGQTLLMGDECKLKATIELKITSPVPAHILLIKNGHRIKEVNGSTKLIWETNERGVYRASARYNDKPWVFTNPIYIR